MNRASITVVGKIPKEPEHSVPKDNTMLKFSVAVAVQTGKGKYETDFYNVTLWGAYAEYIMPHVHKGDMVAVSGTLHMRTYEKKDGSAGYTMEILNATDVTTPSMLVAKAKKETQESEEDELPV